MQTKNTPRRCADCLWYQALYVRSRGENCNFTPTRFGLCSALPPGHVADRTAPACLHFLPETATNA